MKDHLEIQELLPWFVNGSLNEEEHSLVGEHIAECDTCGKAVTQLLSISAQFNAQDPELPHRNINAFIDNLPSQSTNSPGRRWLRPAMAACAVIGLAIVLIFTFPSQDRYRTLGRSESDLKGRAVIQVVFSPNAREREIRKLLLEDGNEVLSGPSRHGVYRVLLGPGQRSEIYIARLQHNPDVVFVDREKPE